MKLQSCKTCASTSFTPIPNGVKCDYCGNEYVENRNSYLEELGRVVSKNTFITHLTHPVIPVSSGKTLVQIKNEVGKVVKEYYE